VELCRKVRLACADGRNKRAAARHFDISRDSVDKILAFSAPAGFRRRSAINRPKPDWFNAIIDAWLDGDSDGHRKQHRAAKRASDRLRHVEPCSRHGSEADGAGRHRRRHDPQGWRPQPATGPRARPTIRERALRGRKMSVSLAHPPEQAQANFGEAIVVIAHRLHWA